MYHDAGNNVVRIEDEHYNSKALLLETIMKNLQIACILIKVLHAHANF